jgi:hypothetical protein
LRDWKSDFIYLFGGGGGDVLGVNGGGGGGRKRRRIGLNFMNALLVVS